MCKYLIKEMESEEEVNGKGYVHYKTWHETYTDLIDAEYMKKITLEKCVEMAHKWLDNLIVAKDGDIYNGIYQGYERKYRKRAYMLCDF